MGQCTKCSDNALAVLTKIKNVDTCIVCDYRVLATKPDLVNKVCVCRY